MTILSVLGRNKEIFLEDVALHESHLSEVIAGASFLVIGGAGSIGQAVTKEIFRRRPRKLHVVDISENNIVELVRDLRSSLGYIDGDFQTYVLDVGSCAYDAFIKSDGNYDFILNLSALKHVRSERDPYTLMRMIDVNILNTEKTLLQSIANNSSKYFCVSTDKAANPVNMMGASKRIMELFLMRRSLEIKISTARFANVAFSDGSLLHSFSLRIEKQQPIVAPHDIRRYFITPKESGELCLMSCILGENRNIFFPKTNDDLRMVSLAEIADKYIRELGYEPYLCESEDEARLLAKSLPSTGRWPCLFESSDTTGEKEFEEFFTDNEIVNLGKFKNIGIIESQPLFDSLLLDEFTNFIDERKRSLAWEKGEILSFFKKIIPEFRHFEKGKNLDGKM